MDMKAAPRVDDLRINGERLWASLMELAQIGATPKGGVCRLTLTDLDKQGRDLVLRWATEAGMTTTIGLAFLPAIRLSRMNPARPTEDHESSLSVAPCNR
mgnify:CR=1 FL=1